MYRQQLSDRAINYVSVLVETEKGCDINEGEYSLYIMSFIGSLDIYSPGGVDDVSLIKDCILNHLDDLNLPEEGCTQIVLRESGEWEDVFWSKYYEIERYVNLSTQEEK